jgi:hypothetical protein
LPTQSPERAWSVEAGRARALRIFRAGVDTVPLSPGSITRDAPEIAGDCLDGSGRFPYLRERDTSPQREASYLEG